jgi:hypothetical protein
MLLSVEKVCCCVVVFKKVCCCFVVCRKKYVVLLCAGASVLLHRNMATEIGAQLSLPWVPPYLKNKGIRTRTHPPGWHKEVRRPYILCHDYLTRLNKNRTGDCLKLKYKF